MVQGRENGQPNVIYHLIQRHSRRARPTRRPQSHLPLRWSRICSKYDHQSAACPLEACREDEDCSMRACFMRMSPHPFGHVIAKYWTAATGSNHPCDHSVESAADGRYSREAHSNGRRGGERSEMRRCGVDGVEPLGRRPVRLQERAAAGRGADGAGRVAAALQVARAPQGRRDAIPPFR